MIRSKQLASVPDREGLAGLFAGVSHDVLLAAGGANFPDKKPWDGGQKVWHDSIFALDKPTGSWQVVGKLPRPLGYGVFASHQNRLLVVGGSDAQQHSADCFSLEWQHGSVHRENWPPLPQPLANACGTLLGDSLLVVGGQHTPTSQPLGTAWRLDLLTRKWSALPACPPRMLAMIAPVNDSVVVAGGVDLVNGQRRYLQDVHAWSPGLGWKRVANLPTPLAAAASPSPSDATGLFIVGGDDGSQVGVPVPRHRGFRTTVLRYDWRTDRWASWGEAHPARVTVPCVRWHDRWVIISGEAKPGVRSPEVWSHDLTS